MSGVHVQSRPLPQPLPHGHGLAARTSWKRDGNVTVSWARAMETDPRSSGVRSDCRTPLSNSGVSSRKSTPRWAWVMAPGRMRPLPPPMTAACDAPWWGATKGGLRDEPDVRHRTRGRRAPSGSP